MARGAGWLAGWLAVIKQVAHSGGLSRAFASTSSLSSASAVARTPCCGALPRIVK